MMMTHDVSRFKETDPTSRMGWLKLLGVVAVIAVIASAASLWVVRTVLLPDAFIPVRLTVNEENNLDEKIEQLERITNSNNPAISPKTVVPPEPYHEDPRMRTIVFSEKELNALLAKNTDLAHKLAIDLSDGMASAKLLLPLAEDFPVLGGKTVRVTAGLGIDYANEKPVIMIKGVSIWGVPIPSAWMGNLKNVDLVNAFGNDQGFWKAFAGGIDKIEIKEKKLMIRLRE